MARPGALIGVWCDLLAAAMAPSTSLVSARFSRPISHSPRNAGTVFRVRTASARLRRASILTSRGSVMALKHTLESPTTVWAKRASYPEHTNPRLGAAEMADRNWFVQSFIDPPTWDAAGWYGTGFLTAPDHSVPPAVVLMFGDGNAARRIFEDLRKRVGAEDEYEELRIAIVEGDIPGEEPGYSVHIGSHIEHILRRAKAAGHEIEPEYIYTFSRINRMNPEEDSPHLGNFKKSYSRHGFYGLMPGVGEGPAV